MNVRASSVQLMSAQIRSDKVLTVISSTFDCQPLSMENLVPLKINLIFSVYLGARL